MNTTAKFEFDNYAKSFNLNESNLNKKYFHTYRVMELCGQIAKSLELSDEEIRIAELIGLLHDIARFEQFTKYQTFSDINSVDHGDLGVDILKKDNYIRNYIDDSSYDNIILKAIENHNKFSIEDGLTDKELLFCKIIRDADKIDILYQASTMFYDDESVVSEIENGIIAKDIMEEIRKGKLLKKDHEKNWLKNVLICLCFIFDFNFEYSIKYVKEKDYLNKIINRFDFKNSDTKEKIEEIRTIINNYKK